MTFPEQDRESREAFEAWWEGHSKWWPLQLKNQERSVALCSWQAAYAASREQLKWPEEKFEMQCLSHPCKQTCSGWNNGMEIGYNSALDEMRRLNGLRADKKNGDVG